MSALPKPATFYTEAMLQKIQEREKELREGGGFEVRSTAELRAEIKTRRAGRVVGGAAA
jgi:hypothetical protein